LAVSKYCILPLSTLHRADAQPHRAGIQQVEIDQFEQRFPERRGVVEADGLRRALRLEQGRRDAGLKKPGTPPTAASVALVSLKIRRELSSVASGQASRRLETRCQNSRKCSTRLSGGLPAMMAELTAPIEMPATQLGMCPASHRAS
jgi:hypothetical protein